MQLVLHAAPCKAVSALLAYRVQAAASALRKAVMAMSALPEPTAGCSPAHAAVLTHLYLHTCNMASNQATGLQVHLLACLYKSIHRSCVVPSNQQRLRNIRTMDAKQSQPTKKQGCCSCCCCRQHSGWDRRLLNPKLPSSAMQTAAISCHHDRPSSAPTHPATSAT